jgi:hypothetical protein
MQEASTLLVLHGNFWITTTKDDLDGIPIGLRTVNHEASEVGLLYAVFSQEFVEFFPNNILDNRVSGLHVTHGNGHDLAICCIVHVTCHCGPFLNTLDMAKHEPRIL